jgi:hypothetical protein
MKLTPDEIHLLREIARWRREMGISYLRWRAFGRYVEWFTVKGKPGVGVEMNADEPEFGFGTYGEIYTWLDTRDVTEAVDILAAKGLLPSRFSSAYRDGREEIEAKARALAEEYQRVDRLVHSAAVAKMLEEWTW